MKIIKTSNKYPNLEEILAHVDSLKLYAENKDITPAIKCTIDNLPTSRQIQLHMSNEEIKILWETVDWLWKKITGKDIISESTIIEKPDTLIGNYWIFNKGILLSGINHYTIIKNNASFICSLLGINGFALQQYLHQDPNNLMKFIIDNGGIRMFVRTNREMFAQLSPQTYRNWGKKKLKTYDFHKKILKLIGPNSKYNGWNSGIDIIIG